LKRSICLSFCGARWRRGNNIRRWSTGFFIAAFIIGIFSVFYGQSVDRFVSAFDFYDTSEQLRQVYLNQRLDSYARFFPLLAVVLLLWAAVLHFHDYLSELKPSVTLFVAIFLVTIVADYFFSTREWIRFGRPCWDYYCTYAQLIYDWLIHATPAAKENLLRFLATDYHANSPVGPLLTVAAMLLTKMSAIGAYRLACGLATLSTLALVWRYLLKPLALDPSEKWAVMLLLSAHLIVARSFVFPQTDAFVLLWTTALLVCGWAWLERPTWQKRVGCFFILTSGLFVKLSFLPALALLPLWKAAQGPRGRPALVALIKEGAFFGLLPFVLYRLFQSAFSLTPLSSRAQRDGRKGLKHSLYSYERLTRRIISWIFGVYRTSRIEEKGFLSARLDRIVFGELVDCSGGRLGSILFGHSPGVGGGVERRTFAAQEGMERRCHVVLRGAVYRG
jgi:hypothetical protein